jgi:tRNA(fMet)-specific endonuclease VapC
MLVLDTDHLTALQRNNADAQRLKTKLLSAEDDVTTTIVNVQEQIEGWLRLITSRQRAAEQVLVYARLLRLIESLADWEVLPFDEQAAGVFERLSHAPETRRLNTMDLKVAAIALSRDALLLSANLRDFRRVPDLRVEDWLHE